MSLSRKSVWDFDLKEPSDEDIRQIELEKEYDYDGIPELGLEREFGCIDTSKTVLDSLEVHSRDENEEDLGFADSVIGNFTEKAIRRILR